MIGLIISIIVFNIIAFKTNKKLTKNQIIHIWAITIAFQHVFDTALNFKYHAYWYFSNQIDWQGLLAYLFLIPPVNMIFLNWYPFGFNILKRIRYFIYWLIFILCYEALTTLPEPWGFYTMGWWTLWHSAIVDPILLFILLKYYNWVCSAEKELLKKV